MTGASSGIGEATARALVADGFQVVLAARRLERLEKLAAELGPATTAVQLDITDPGSVRELAESLPSCHVLVNNAGGAKGLAPVEETDEDQWRWMYETNVLGTMRVTKALLPALRASGDGHIVVVSSISGHETYAGGAGYTGAKHAQSAMARTLRLELLGQPIRITEICPGIVETEFSLVRFDGDAEAAKKPYVGLRPLVAEDVAECVRWAVMLPSHVNIDRIDVRPRSQATATVFHRES